MIYPSDNNVTTNRISNGLYSFGYIEIIKIPIVINRKTIFWAARYYGRLVNGKRAEHSLRSLMCCGQRNPFPFSNNISITGTPAPCSCNTLSYRVDDIRLLTKETYRPLFVIRQQRIK